MQTSCLESSQSNDTHHTSSNTHKAGLHHTRRVGGVPGGAARRAIGGATERAIRAVRRAIRRASGGAVGVVVVLGAVTRVTLGAAIAHAGFALRAAPILVVVSHGTVFVGGTATGLVGAAGVRAGDAVHAAHIFVDAASAGDAGGRRKRQRGASDQRAGFGDRSQGAQLDRSALSEGGSACHCKSGEREGEGDRRETHLNGYEKQGILQETDTPNLYPISTQPRVCLEALFPSPSGSSGQHDPAVGA